MASDDSAVAISLFFLNFTIYTEVQIKSPTEIMIYVFSVRLESFITPFASITNRCLPALARSSVVLSTACP